VLIACNMYIAKNKKNKFFIICSISTNILLISVMKFPAAKNFDKL